MLKAKNLKDRTAAARAASIDANGNAKVNDLDCIDVRVVRIDKNLGYLQLGFKLGHVENGAFVPSAYPAHEFQIDSSSQPHIWQKHQDKIDAVLAILEDILHEESGVAQAAIVAWNLPGVGSVVE